MTLKISRLRMHLYVLPLIFLMITLYFTYHLIQGERGLFRLFAVNKELEEANILLEKSEQEKSRIEAKIKSFSSDSLSADRLDELGRQELGFVNPDEYVIFE
ncbi:MAG: septum formation initiator family protein [Alphaproteobacteria bacterium]|nr:septum formation initiator family protein [Alphaproteobacteria bacterium]